jgi:hypothetical protein
MPRLDWQMWFAALGDYRGNPWLVRLMRELGAGNEHVLALLSDNPFPDAPPRFVRALIYRYHFTTPDEREHTGNPWRREDERLYAPTVGR